MSYKLKQVVENLNQIENGITIENEAQIIFFPSPKKGPSSEIEGLEEAQVIDLVSFRYQKKRESLNSQPFSSRNSLFYFPELTRKVQG